MQSERVSFYITDYSKPGSPHHLPCTPLPSVHSPRHRDLPRSSLQTHSSSIWRPANSKHYSLPTVKCSGNAWAALRRGKCSQREDCKLVLDSTGRIAGSRLLGSASSATQARAGSA